MSASNAWRCSSLMFVSAIGFSGAVAARVLPGDRSLQLHAIHAACRWPLLIVTRG